MFIQSTAKRQEVEAAWIDAASVPARQNALAPEEHHGQEQERHPRRQQYRPEQRERAPCEPDDPGELREQERRQRHDQDEADLLSGSSVVDTRRNDEGRLSTDQRRRRHDEQQQYQRAPIDHRYPHAGLREPRDPSGIRHQAHHRNDRAGPQSPVSLAEEASPQYATVSRMAWSTSEDCGRIASSRSGQYATGVSMAATRRTGASRCENRS